LSLAVIVLLSISSCSVFAQSCTNPTVSDIQTFTTQDGKLNTEIAYTIQFRLSCANKLRNAALFADLNGRILSSSVDESGERYQIGWTEPVKTARSGEIRLRLFDEDGFAALKKAQRNNEDLSKVKELRTVSVYHAGSYTGPLVQPELIFTVFFGAIYYWAFTTRSNLQA